MVSIENARSQQIIREATRLPNKKAATGKIMQTTPQIKKIRATSDEMMG
jgi:hypothetical protein